MSTPVVCDLCRTRPSKPFSPSRGFAWVFLQNVYRNEASPKGSPSGETLCREAGVGAGYSRDPGRLHPFISLFVAVISARECVDFSGKA